MTIKNCSFAVNNLNTATTFGALENISFSGNDYDIHYPLKLSRAYDGIFNFEGSDTWDPGSIADGEEDAKDVTVTGAILGDFAIASFSRDVTDLVLNAQVTAADTVTCILANNTGGAIDLAEGTIYVKVIKK